MGEKDNRFNMPKPPEKQETAKPETQIKQVIEQAKDEGWTIEKLGKKLDSLNFNFDDLSDKMANRLLAKFQELDKTPETKPEDKPTEDKPQKVEIVKPEEQEKPERKTGLFGISVR